MAAGNLASIADVEDLFDLREGKSGSLAAVDEVDPSRCFRIVVAVSRRGALGRGKQALLLVEPQGLGGGAGNCRLFECQVCAFAGMLVPIAGSRARLA